MSKGVAFIKNKIQGMEERRDQVKYFIQKESSRGKYIEEKTVTLDEPSSIIKGT